MRSYPTDEDKKEVEKLNADDWQINLLKLNPEYVFWGCFENYMSEKDKGWSSRVITPTWKEHGFGLDEYNELASIFKYIVKVMNVLIVKVEA